MDKATPAEAKKSARRARLAKQILHYIREHDLTKGHHLTESSLAEVFQVSRSPIRAALQHLTAHGVVEARPHQGFFLAKSGGGLDRVGIDVPQTRDEELYERVIDAHLSGRIGAVVNQIDLMREFDVGRNVVERTLARLSDERLIERGAGQGWTFLPTLNTVEARRSSYEVRLALEPAGILLPTFRVDTNELERARTRHVDYLARAGKRRSEPSLSFGLDAAFHELIAASTGNVFWVETVRRHNRLRRLLEYRGDVDADRVDEWCSEHLAILDALKVDDRETAADLMQQHLMQARLDMEGVDAAR